MYATASKEEITSFLDKCKSYIFHKKVDFILGPEEKYTLSNMGISYQDAFELVNEITYMNYYRGPSADHKNPSEVVWEFGFEEVPQDIYIKLKFRNNRDDLLMLSFHYAERPITYAYR
ncbi:hypothetical protein SM124_21030 [Bacillus sp. 31A1R]|uniref:Toxin n=1 Tax=Robertmurraya mangrovi TaxID=3098077 RepID=A0ABU5J483_9BACI|nr:hypothetical protein [Bacillus sp. 31A1R]MDZ5474182.1 hypothetical protein [Bacillus sp. 31A1R]